MSPRPAVRDHDLDPAGVRLATLMGAALAGGGVLAAILLRLWLGSLPLSMRWTDAWSWALLTFAALLVAACLWQWAAWRAHPSVPRASSGLLGSRASWWVHALSYLLALAGIVAMGAVIATVSSATVGFWLALAAGLLLLLGQALGATQYLRDRGLPGTVGTHVRGAIARSNARADARADAAEAEAREERP